MGTDSFGATKRIVNYGNAGYYQVLSAEVGGKHGFSVSGLVFDEIHTQPNRRLYDVWREIWCMAVIRCFVGWRGMW